MADTTNNIMFKRGPQAKLDTIDTALEGCFYLTTDTNRLYVGQSGKGKPQLLNQTVQIKDNVASLPTAPTINDFYYCREENILAVYGIPKGKTAAEWIQINPDHNDNDIVEVSGASFGDGAVDATNNNITYNLTISQNKKDKDGVPTALDDITATLTLTSEDLEQIIHNPASVGLDVSGEANSNIATIKTTGEGKDDTETVSLKGGDNVEVSVNGDEITISAQDTQYSLNATNKALEDGDGTSVAVFAAGDGLDIDVSGKNITYSHSEYTTETDDSNTEDIDESARTFTVVTNIDADNGHITKIYTTDFTLPEDNHLTAVTNNENWTATLELKSELENDLVVDFSKEAGALEEKLEKSIDDKLAAVNSALTYKGTVTTIADLEDKTSVEIGDVWLFAEEIDNAEISNKTIDVKIGDLVIATSKSGNTKVGVITEEDLEWQHIPSGNELNTDTQYHGDLSVANNTITYTLVPSVGADQEDTAPSLNTDHEDLVIEAGTDLTITSSGPKAVINHKTIETADATEDQQVTINQGTSFTAITGLTIDNGHITGYSTGAVNVDEYALSGSENAITLTDTTGNTSSVGVSGDDHITATVDGNNLSITHNNNFDQAADVEVEIPDIELTSKEIEYISKISYDEAGHLIGVETNKFATPDVDFELSNSVPAEGVDAVENPSIILGNSTTPNSSSIQLNGADNLVISANANGAINFELVWGTFD